MTIALRGALEIRNTRRGIELWEGKANDTDLSLSSTEYYPAAVWDGKGERSIRKHTPLRETNPPARGCSGVWRSFISTGSLRTTRSNTRTHQTDGRINQKKSERDEKRGRGWGARSQKMPRIRQQTGATESCSDR